ncbi:L,D-transpeptidase family protein [Pelagibacterales bacterium]|nr:L,D-transpeptidase family protein [Pelagibacterales bacterium]|tara:strand:- start:179 stop:670 length:492 start_codon:yes stop_codon:yes gene_type:complete
MIIVRNKVLKYKNFLYKCAIGKNGITNNKIEGDKCTPSGIYSIDQIYYRKDKLTLPTIDFQTTPINKNFGWCDDTTSSHYNKFIEFPFSDRAEILFREDEIYNIICVISYNTNPIIKNKGSAIFLHVANTDYSGTAGCLALKQSDLIELLQNINIDTKIHIVD